MKTRNVSEELRMLRDALQKRISQLTVLYQMGRDIAENENWSDALDRFLMALVKYMRADGTALLLFSQEETRLAIRANFHIDASVLEESRTMLLEGWRKHPRATEIHSLEGYRDNLLTTCLERSRPWRITIIPLRHRSRSLGFLVLEKSYAAGTEFGIDYQFLNTIQTIFTEQVANAAYISELRSLSQFNRKVLENMNSGVITTDLDGNIRFCNRRAATLCPQLQEGSNTHFDTIFSSAAFGDGFFEKLKNSPKDNHVLEVQGTNGSGGSFPVQLSTSKMFDDTLNGVVLVAIFEDLTDQKKLQAEVRKNDRLRTLGQLSASVAHEIRNPLTGIATSVEVLESKLKRSPENAKYFKAIIDEISRLDGIIKNLLDFAKPAKPRLRDCFLGEVIARVVNLLSDHATKRGITLAVTTSLADDRCRADADQLTQVLLNLVLNAVQACREGDTIKLRLSEAPPGHDTKQLQIEVIDTGPGVSPEVRETLFEPFVTTKTRGTGMGLAISRQIVEEHQGSIFCEFSQTGSKFIILLPIESMITEAHTVARSENHAKNNSHY